MRKCCVNQWRKRMTSSMATGQFNPWREKIQTHQPIHPSILSSKYSVFSLILHLSFIYHTFHSSIDLSIHPPIYPCMHPNIHPFIHSFFCSFISFFIHAFIHCVLRSLQQVTFSTCYCQCSVSTRSMYGTITTACKCWPSTNRNWNLTICSNDMKRSLPVKEELWKHFSPTLCIRCSGLLF